MRRMPELLKGFMVVAMLVAAGCTDAGTERETARVTGTVLLDGQPLTSGVIHFRAANTGNAAMAALNSNGHFQIEELFADTYAVTVAPPTPTPENPMPVITVEFPGKYREAATSGLTAEVKSGNNVFEFAMMR